MFPWKPDRKWNSSGKAIVTTVTFVLNVSPEIILNVTTWWKEERYNRLFPHLRGDVEHFIHKNPGRIRINAASYIVGEENAAQLFNNFCFTELDSNETWYKERR